MDQQLWGLRRTTYCPWEGGLRHRSQRNRLPYLPNQLWLGWSWVSRACMFQFPFAWFHHVAFVPSFGMLLQAMTSHQVSSFVVFIRVRMGIRRIPWLAFWKAPSLSRYVSRSITTSNKCWCYFFRHSGTSLHPPLLLIRARLHLGSTTSPTSFGWTTMSRHDLLHTLQLKYVSNFLWFLDPSSCPFPPSSSFHLAWHENGSMNTTAFTIHCSMISLLTSSRILRTIQHRRRLMNFLIGGISTSY